MILSTRQTKAFSAIIDALPHALVLSGPASKGAFVESQALAQMVKQKYGGVVYPLRIQKDKKAITIDQIKELYHLARARQKEGLLIVVVPGFDSVHIDAQNAFLKLLEEPGDNIVFILECAQITKILPTILSRAQHLEMDVFDAKLAAQFAQKNKTDETIIGQLTFLSEGNATYFVKLVEDKSYQKKLLSVAGEAKLFLTQKPYERLVTVQAFAKSREDAMAFLNTVVRMAELMLRSKPEDIRYVSLIDHCEAAYRTIAANGHVKLQLLRLTTSLSS